MKKSKVVLVRCCSYNRGAVERAIARGVDLLGGMGKFALPGEKILLKPNVLAGDPPERCVSTHPEVLRAVGSLLKDRAGEVCFGDSPSSGDPLDQLKTSGLLNVGNELGMKVADFREGKVTTYKQSPYTKRFLIAKGVLEADGIISLCKFKTHMLTRMTGAVKNQFGCIPGRDKKGFHIKLPSSSDFSRMLVALTLCLKPRLYIMDGIMAMEGNGPRGGRTVPMNTLLFSEDPVALDAVACRLVDLDPKNVPTSETGREWGLGTYLEEEIEILGDRLEDLINRNFDVSRKPFRDILPTGTISFIKNLIIPRPVIDKTVCVMCGACVRACPADPKALDWKMGNTAKPPEYTYRRCIRCYCCQEICPEGAIFVKDSAFTPVGRS